MTRRGHEDESVESLTTEIKRVQGKILSETFCYVV